MLESIFSWNTLWVLMWILYIPACVGLIAIVLLQKGKSSGFAGAFGVGGGSETVFGPRARKSLPVKATYAMAAVFMILSMSMSLVAGRVHRGDAPEAVEVDGTVAPEHQFDALWGLPDSTDPASAPSTPALLDGAPAESPDQQPVAESPADEAAAAESSDAAAPEAAAAEPAGDAATNDAASSAN